MANEAQSKPREVSRSLDAISHLRVTSHVAMKNYASKGGKQASKHAFEKERGKQQTHEMYHVIH
jgi:hypothetical protein